MPQSEDAYIWLDSIEPEPRMVAEARKLLGVLEHNGASNSPTIMGWAASIGGDVAEAFKADEIPWCGLFMAYVARQSGKTPVAEPLWALNWRKFGTPAGQPGLGDVLVFLRPKGGHVALYVGEDDSAYHVLGGNQSDQVCYERIPKERLVDARRPPYMNQPSSVKPYIIAATGSESDDEQ